MTVNCDTTNNYFAQCYFFLLALLLRVPGVVNFQVSNLIALCGSVKTKTTT